MFDAEYGPARSDIRLRNLVFGFFPELNGLYLFSGNSTDLFLVLISAQSQDGKKRVESCDLLPFFEEKKLIDEDLFIDKENLSTEVGHNTSEDDSFYTENSESDVESQDDDVESQDNIPSKSKNNFYLYSFLIFLSISFCIFLIIRYHQFQKYKLEEKNSFDILSSDNNE